MTVSWMFPTMNPFQSGIVKEMQITEINQFMFQTVGDNGY